MKRLLTMILLSLTMLLTVSVGFATSENDSFSTELSANFENATFEDVDLNVFTFEGVFLRCDFETLNVELSKNYFETFDKDKPKLVFYKDKFNESKDYSLEYKRKLLRCSILNC
jgi:hypothetical protein